MKKRCKDCFESVGMVDASAVWCVIVGGVVNNDHSCDKFRKGVEDEPIIADHWPADNTD